MFEILRNIYREFGFAAGSIYCTDRLLRRISGRLRLYYYELMMQPLRTAPLLPQSMSRRFAIREILADQPEISLMPARPDILKLRFDQKTRCLGLFRDGELAGYVWIGFGRYKEDEVRCDFELMPADKSCFDFDFYIFPKFRMGPAFAALWDGTNEFMGDLGIDQTFSRMTRFNSTSRGAHLRMGSIRIGKALFVHLFGVQIAISSVPKFFHVSLHPNSRARLLLKRA